MSNLYKKYIEEKKKDDSVLYLFKSGMFYIFLDEDSKKINSITTLKLTNLTNDIVKCGFPNKCLDKYLNIFNNLNLNIKIIESSKDTNEDFDKLINQVRRLDLNLITPIDAFDILRKIKDSLNG